MGEKEFTGYRFRPTEILGVSHLVLGSPDAQKAEHFLARFGHSKYSEVEDAPNPPEKTPFVAGSLARTFAMKLMVSAIASPPVEVLHENAVYTYETVEFQPVFEAVLGTEADEELCRILDTLEGDVAVPFTGFREICSCSQNEGVIALLVHCYDLNTTLPLWQTLGFKYTFVDSSIIQVKIRGTLASNRLTVYFIRDRPYPTEGYLNQTGIVCLSLWCRDADRLRLILREEGYFVSNCFTLAPFGRQLRIFFLRNLSGEIYEFLSVLQGRQTAT